MIYGQTRAEPLTVWFHFAWFDPLFLNVTSQAPSESNIPLISSDVPLRIDPRTSDWFLNDLFSEPSRRELAAYEEIVQKMNATQKFIGKAYCTLILGIGLAEHHHMNCGS